jgi:cbb3-type cytochrome oxidase subunit 3
MSPIAEYVYTAGNGSNVHKIRTQLLSGKLKTSTYKSQSHGSHRSSENVAIAAIVLATIAIVLIAFLFFMYQTKYRTKATTVVELKLSTEDELQYRNSTLGDDRILVFKRQ